MNKKEIFFEIQNHLILFRQLNKLLEKLDRSEAMPMLI